MDIAQHFARSFAWNAWAHRETLASLERAGKPPTKAVALLSHVIGAELLWSARLRRERAPIAVWPELSLAECARHLPDLAGIWRRHLIELVPARLEETIPYVNSRGEHYRSSVYDVLVHVVYHGAYHRGQIASLLRAAGAEPAYTDYVHAVRTGAT
jgi:uncharacterized damage-inducible protein DinB